MAKKGGSKQKKMNARVDFTPMVDMIMLLVTFFMLCTSLIKPKTMEISMPSNKQDLKEDQKSQVAASKAITILLDENNTLYYFTGLPDTAKLHPVTYGKDGIRAALLGLNSVAQQQVQELKRKYELKRSSNPSKDKQVMDEYRTELNKIKNSDITPSVIIKATDKATYKNLIDVLDEMQICCIGKYVIDKIADADIAKIKALKANPAAAK